MSKKVDISDQTYQAIAAISTDVSAFVEKAAQRQLKTHPVTESLKNLNLVERFREFRGTMQGITIDEIVASRHAGLR